jgi:ECF sigma factor
MAQTPRKLRTGIVLERKAIPTNVYVCYHPHMETASANITQLLAEWRRGDETAFEQLAPAVYDRLHAIAESYLRGERPTHTLQATALVNELFLRLMRNSNVQYASREHFYAFAAKLMRRILVDYARRDGSKKRGEHAERVLLAPDWLGWMPRRRSCSTWTMRSPNLRNWIRSKCERSNSVFFSAQLLWKRPSCSVNPVRGWIGT